MSNARTPMMAQYHALKDEVSDCLLFYRMGDFFELFFDDAVVASGVLDIALTARGEQDGERVPMCGVPVHAADAYLARLIRAGHRVAIAEQVESPAQARAARGSKALVERAIVRVVTAGTLTEDALLEARSANWLVAIVASGVAVGVAAADISTGALELSTHPAGEMETAIARYAAREVIIPAGANFLLRETMSVERPAKAFDSRAGDSRLRAMHGVATLDAFGDFSRHELSAAAGLLDYLDHTGKGALPWLAPPLQRTTAAHMAIDAASRDSLELVCSVQGTRKGSLLECIDRTVTGAGARLLADDLSAPLTDRAAIEARLGLVASWVADTSKRETVREALRRLPDLARALARLSSGRGSPRDLGSIRDGLAEAWALRDRLDDGEATSKLLGDLLPALAGHGALIDLLTRALVPEPPLDAGQGGYIAAGYDAALDALRDSGGAGRRELAALEAKFRADTSVGALKIKHNGVLGYHIEVPARFADPLMAADSGFTHRQTLAGVVRFNAPALHEIAMRVAQAGSHALTAEAAHFEDLVTTVLTSARAISATAAALARIDVAAGNAQAAIECDWCRPQLVDHACLQIVGGRHPVVEMAVRQGSDRFVANDCSISMDDRLWLVTGPNMGGKSTFLRQNALIAVMAQAGCFVPAKSATLGVVDRLFSRVGASDNLARGRSTFMVEMVETAAILAQATPNSFVILDEVGRGTSTYDGLAIAWSVVEAVHDVARCRCLFATHYHELTRLAETLPAMSLYHVRAREHKGDLVLLHEIADGPADRSYGIAVARLAGLPPAVVARAKTVLARLEAGRAATGGIAAGLDDLPLFSTIVEDAPVDALRAALDAIVPDRLSPREALDLLYELKKID